MKQKILKYLLTGLFTVSAFSVVPTLAVVQAEPPAGYKLAWADEFDGSELDTTKWDYVSDCLKETTGNGRDAINVAGGFLTIRAYTEGDKHFNGQISTQGKFERSFGYYEARIMFQDSPGVTSAFWIDPPNKSNESGDPATAGMQIIILEHRAVDKDGQNIADKTGQGLKWNGNGKKRKSAWQLTENLGLANGFHIYGLEWTKEGYRFFIDGKPTWMPLTPVSERPEHINLYCAVKGGWAGEIPAAGYGSREASKTNMVVDYVRHYERLEPALDATPAPQSTPTPADRIKQIKQLLEQGLIDKQEYDRRVKEILDAI